MKIFVRRLRVLASYGTALCALLPLIQSFTVNYRRTRLPRISTLFLSSPQLNPEASYASNDSALNDLQIHRNQLAESLEKINKLQASLLEAKADDSVNALEDELIDAEKLLSVWLGALVPPVGLSLQDYARAIDMYVRLPFRMRVAICMALELEESVKAASDWDRVPEIVALWYEDHQKQQQQGAEDKFLLTPQRIQSAMKDFEITLAKVREMNQLSTSSSSSSSPFKGGSSRGVKGKTSKGSNSQSIFSDDMDKEEFATEATVQQLFGRVTRKDDRVATEQDLETLGSALNNKLFLPSEKPVAIKGGYIIRGKNQKKSGADLIQALDQKLPKDWSCQVCYIQDDFSRDEDGTRLVLGGDADKLLLLLKKDMSPTTNPWIFAGTSAAALCIAFLFSVGVYGGNDSFQTSITDQSLFFGASDSSSLFGWMNGKVCQVFLSLGAIQFFHDAGQWIVAKRAGMKTSLPTLLPGLGLPFLNSMVKIEESPKNFRTLFDYAIIGPLLGLGASFIFLVTGLQLTSLADAATAQALPALPVNVLCISTLGATVIDYIYGGGPGFVSLQDPQSFVQLHPLAIAGFTGLVMNALEVLPLGGTDGGRMALAVFGRGGHSIISGFTWLILLVAALFLERGDALVGAWAVYNIACSDSEVPCRDEVEQIDVTRALAAGALWFLAILAITPL